MTRRLLKWITGNAEALDLGVAEPFAGRAFELSLFRSLLRGEPRGSERILNVYGAGGIGKSALLAQFRAFAEAEGCRMFALDMRDAASDPALFCREAAAGLDRKSTRLNSSHIQKSRMPSSA